MPFAFLKDLLPEVAEHETRSITVLDGSDLNLEPDTYGFLEMFCDEPGCDCRRVFFYVIAVGRREVQAVIGWGWESRGFYARWMGDDDPVMLDELVGPALNLGSPQGSHAKAVLDVCRSVLLRDAAFVERVKRHYAMFRERVEGGGRPRQRGSKMGKKRRRAW